MTTPRFILSTVGISLLLKQVNRPWRGRLLEEANEPELSPEVAEKVENLVKQAGETLRENDVAQNRALSAELNGLYAIYEGQLTRARGDMHYLIATDTVLGRKAAEVVQDYVRSQGVVSNIYVPPQLSSAAPSQFSHGIKQLINWCEAFVPEYRASGYHIIFNLTGGFKSLQGYLNIVGMFYADRLVYIFERSDALLTIPRLPIRVADEMLREHKVPLAMMAQYYLMPRERVQQIPGGLLDTDGELATLSDWGLLVWNRARHALLSEELLSFPRLEYTSRFRRAFEDATPQQRVALQDTLARVATILEENDGDPNDLRQDTGLQYENYTHRETRDGRPIGHFHLSKGRRVSCTLEEGGILRLRTFGGHDVNDNP